MKTAALSTRISGRLTEHTVYVDLVKCPEIESGTDDRTGSFAPTQLIIGFQYSWNSRKWYPLFVQAVGKTQDGKPAKTTYTDPTAQTCPSWIRDVVTGNTPALGPVT